MFFLKAPGNIKYTFFVIFYYKHLNYIGNIVQIQIGVCPKEDEKYLGKNMFAFLFSLSTLNHSKLVGADYSISSSLLVMLFSNKNTNVSIAANVSVM